MMNKYSAVNPHSLLTPEQIQIRPQNRGRRAAAKLSTGPRTAEGKAASSKNAIKHGFAGAIMVIDDEDKEAYELHLEAYHQCFRPVSQPECDAVRLAANALWRIDRLTSIETGLFELEASFNAPHVDAMMQNQSLHHYYAVAFKQQIGESNPIDLCRRYLSSAQRDFHRAIVTFNLLKENRIPAATPETKPAEKQEQKTVHLVSKPQSNRQEPNELAQQAEKQPPQASMQLYSAKQSRKARKQGRKMNK